MFHSYFNFGSHSTAIKHRSHYTAAEYKQIRNNLQTVLVPNEYDREKEKLRLKI